VFPTKSSILALIAAASLAACSAQPPPAAGGETRPAESGYLAPPSVERATQQGDFVVLAGRADPAAQIRLANPGGPTRTAVANRAGAWTLTLPRPSEAQIFGLSMVLPSRQVQAQGYILVTPKGQAALLRAGTGATRLDDQPEGSIGAVDFDRDGGAVISGRAPAEAALSVRLDGRQTAEGRSDGNGRYVIQLPRIAAGAHRLEVVGDTFADTAQVGVSAGAPLAAGPLRSQLSAGGLRADWLTPGGGVQSTVIID
jgi:hypothetical protein